MAPVIDVVRHAQAWHNTTGDTWIRDPDLTTEGEKEAFILGLSYTHMDQVSHIVSSPMWCAVRTCVIAFESALLAGKKVVLLGELQETGPRPSDTGSSRETLEREFRPQVDISNLERDWFSKRQGSKYEPDLALIEERAREARVFLRELAQKATDNAHIIVMSHGGFLHFLTEDFSGLREWRFSCYGNTKMRSFQFVDLHGKDLDAKMVETEESCKSSGWPCFKDMSEDEKKLLKSYAVARVNWQKEDYDNMTKPNRPPVQTHVF
ncbi:histidine phosphatase superfamily [Nemania sp. FL0031]|nr:histidine phosphatase superfamily [Nemania sp. FL0031]